MREIVTLQLGSLSNYTATHFWNAQESYFTYGDQQASPVDHNVHWRAGLAHDGTETFLPRTVVYDLKGGFGPLRKINALYDARYDAVPDVHAAAADSLWSGPPTVHHQPAVAPSAYQLSLDAGAAPARLTRDAVRGWTDFSRVLLHPRSLVQLYDFELDSATRPFERFAMGAELFAALDKEHGLVDRDWRPFVEECDAMQGMQVLTTLDDAWAGFAAEYLEALRDEYPKSCLWVWGLQTPLRDGASREHRQLRLVNTALSLASQACSSLASAVVPLAAPPEAQLPPSLAMDRSSPWHVSALLSTAMESATLPSRLAAASPVSLADMAEGLSTGGTRILASAQMDVGPRADDPGRETLDMDLFPIGRSDKDRARRQERPGRVFGQLSSYRGSCGLEDTAGDAPDPRSRRAVGSPVLCRHTSPLLFPLLDSYPQIYTHAPAGQAGMPVRTVVSTSSAMSARIKVLRSQVSRSIALDERETLSSGLMDIADAYQDGWSSGSDQDDDDV